MNVMRTIQRDEKEEWIDLLFEQGPHEDHPGLGEVPA